MPDRSRNARARHRRSARHDVHAARRRRRTGFACRRGDDSAMEDCMQGDSKIRLPRAAYRSEVFMHPSTRYVQSLWESASLPSAVTIDFLHV